MFWLCVWKMLKKDVQCVKENQNKCSCFGFFIFFPCIILKKMKIIKQFFLQKKKMPLKLNQQRYQIVQNKNALVNIHLRRIPFEVAIWFFVLRLISIAWRLFGVGLISSSWISGRISTNRCVGWLCVTWFNPKCCFIFWKLITKMWI